MKGTKIEWATNTFNPWEGCVKVSKGCANCYAETRANRYKSSKWGPHTAGATRVVRSENYWKEAMRWGREAAWCGNRVCHPTALGRMDGHCSCGLQVERPTVFCASLADIFEQWPGFMLHSNGDPLHVCSVCGDWQTMENMCCGPTAHMPLTMNGVRGRVFNLIRATPQMDWLLVTKRPENIAAMMPDFATYGNNELTGEPLRRSPPWPNVWLITSVEDQPTADRRIDELLKVPAVVHGLSMEPLLEHVNLSPWLSRLGWVIVGGESGPGARRCDLAAVKSVVDQCRAAKVPVFVKQLGADPTLDETRVGRDGWTRISLPVRGGGDGLMHVELDDPKGGDMGEWPEQLRVREFPTPAIGA